MEHPAHVPDAAGLVVVGRGGPSRRKHVWHNTKTNEVQALLRRTEGYHISGRPVFKCEVSCEVVCDVVGVAAGQGSAYGADLGERGREMVNTFKSGNLQHPRGGADARDCETKTQTSRRSDQSQIGPVAGLKRLNCPVAAALQPAADR